MPDKSYFICNCSGGGVIVCGCFLICRALRSGAERGGHCVHGETSRAQAFALIGRSGREAGKDQEPVGGEFARIFRRRVVARRKGEGRHLHEAGARFGLEAAQQFLFAGRDEARNRDRPASCLRQDRLDFGGVLFGGLFHREAHVREEGRGKQQWVAHGIPAARRVEDGVLEVGEAGEALGVAALPDGARGVELDVAADGGERGTDGGCDPEPPWAMARATAWPCAMARAR